MKPLHLFFEEAPHGSWNLCNVEEKSPTYPFRYADGISFVCKTTRKRFCRKRKAAFSDTIRFLLTATGDTIRREWVGFWDFHLDMAPIPAFSQQRQKLLPDSMEFLFHIFKDSFFFYGYIRGYPAIIAAASLLTVVLCVKERANKRLYPIIHKRWIIGIGIMSGCWHPDERIMSLLVPISVISSG